MNSKILANTRFTFAISVFAVSLSIPLTYSPITSNPVYGSAGEDKDEDNDSGSGITTELPDPGTVTMEELNKEQIDTILQYCRFTPDEDIDIKADLVDTGLVNKTYTRYTCDKAEKMDNLIDQMRETFEDFTSDLKLLQELE